MDRCYLAKKISINYEEFSNLSSAESSTTATANSSKDSASSKEELIMEMLRLDYIIYYIPIHLFVVLANTLRIIGIKKTTTTNNKQSSTKDLFILSSWVGIFTSTTAIVAILGNMYLGCDVEFIGLNFEKFSLLFDFFILFLAGILRYLSIRYPFNKISRKFVYVALATYLALLMFALAYTILMRYGLNGSYYTQDIHFQILIFGMAICFVVNGISCFFLQCLLLQRRYPKHHQCAPDQINDQSLAKQKKAAQRLSVINAVYLTFNTPFMVCLLTLNFTKPTYQDIIRWIITIDNCSSMCSMYSGISAAIYIVWDRDIKNLYKKILGRITVSERRGVVANVQ